MERSYLNTWTNFRKQSKHMIDTHFDELIRTVSDPNDMLRGLRGLSVCKIEARDKRDAITKKALIAMEQNKKLKLDH